MEFGEAYIYNESNSVRVPRELSLCGKMSGWFPIT